jgi:hypothetical protein
MPDNKNIKRFFFSFFFTDQNWISVNSNLQETAAELKPTKSQGPA